MLCPFITHRSKQVPDSEDSPWLSEPVSFTAKALWEGLSKIRRYAHAYIQTQRERDFICIDIYICTQYIHDLEVT